MKLAVLIGVPTYLKQPPLPACANDIELMSALVEKDFDPILRLDAHLPAKEVKGSLARFIAANKINSIEQILYYFSGHGDFEHNEFYYLLNDFESSKREQTALTNTELDGMLRSLNATLTVKIVDACHAGQQYVKDSDSLEAYIKSTKAEFKNCYFLYSCQQLQCSFADASFSAFTRAIGEAVAGFAEGEDVRYKDLIDCVSDAFCKNTKQRPLFVVQADFTDVFGRLNAAKKTHITALLSPALTPPVSGQTTADQAQPDPLAAIKAKADQYWTKDQVYKWFNDLREGVSAFVLPHHHQDIYSLSLTIKTTSLEVPNPASIGNWLKSNPGGYFADPRYEKETYEADEYVPKPYHPGLAGLGMLPSAWGEYELRRVIKHRKVVRGFEVTASMPYVMIATAVTPKLSGLAYCEQLLTVVASRRDAVLFLARHVLKETDWDRQVRPDVVKWTFYRVEFVNDPEATTTIKHVMDRLVVFLDEQVAAFVKETRDGQQGSES